MLESLSVAWGIGAGLWAVLSALGTNSLSVLGLGLNVFADVAGSIAVGWRLWLALRHGGDHPAAERVARTVVQGSLAAVAVFLGTESVGRFLAASSSRASASSLAAASASVVILGSLGAAKRRTGRLLTSRALEGDGALSLIGAGIAGLALAALLLERVGWWWADPAAALVVAAVAATELVRIHRAAAP